MILDKKLQASLDQGKGLLIMLPAHSTHVVYSEIGLIIGDCWECCWDYWYAEWSSRCIKNKSRSL